MGGIVHTCKDPDPIPKSVATPELLAYIATAKYEDALPLYRQEKIFARFGVAIDRTSMARWMISLGRLVQPLLNLMREELASSPVLHCDETPVQVLKEKDRPAESKSYMWLLGRNTENPLLLFAYHQSRGKVAGKEVLDEFKGTLVCDGLATYDSLAAKENFQLAGCMAHARRKFFEAEKAEKAAAKGKAKAPIAAAVALDYIRKLYAIERSLIDQPVDEIYRVRQSQSVPLLEEMKLWMAKQGAITLPKSALGRAIGYTQGQWVKLVMYCSDGRVAIDNNFAEGHIRPFVMGRKNWLFSDSPKGAEASAALYSLIESAKANRIQAYDYLRLIFKELPKAKTIDDIDKLLPHQAAHHFPLPAYLPRK